ncbi:hypothetical protein DdX_15432 [Ditylenchus destructor]|uniref:Uncharacterized protein n=1 Tax=Ditylenchus destructor TaxID=166010 RepID=A0AAD4MSS8_9BILA|nr:hypothetical protein DdX_15432 [Ditylenchus destructor]
MERSFCINCWRCDSLLIVYSSGYYDFSFAARVFLECVRTLSKHASRESNEEGLGAGRGLDWVAGLSSKGSKKDRDQELKY